MAKRPHVPSGFSWKIALAYGASLASGTALLDWLDYQRVVRSAPATVYGTLIATTFLALGIAVGMRLVRRAPQQQPIPLAPAALGITPREFEVLHAIAEGLSTKDIARRLGISPNTVKTHSARLFEKLSAARRTEAIARARSLGLIH